IRDVRCDLCGVEERWPERLTQELPDLVLPEKQRLDPLSDIVDRARGVERGQLRRLLRTIRERRRIERQDLRSRLRFLPPVESLPGLFADPPALDERRDER